MIKKIVIFSAALSLLFFITVSPAGAREGTIELSNQAGSDEECYALSVLMEDVQYSILMTCRDLVYPGGENIFYYVAWSQPEGDLNPYRLGVLDKGKRRFVVEDPFQSIFVTRETVDNPRDPSTEVVMRGTVQPIDLFSDNQEDQRDEEQNSPSPSPTEESQESKSSSMRSLLAAGGVIGFIAIVGAIIAVFVITRR